MQLSPFILPYKSRTQVQPHSFIHRNSPIQLYQFILVIKYKFTIYVYIRNGHTMKIQRVRCESNDALSIVILGNDDNFGCQGANSRFHVDLKSVHNGVVIVSERRVA